MWGGGGVGEYTASTKGGQEGIYLFLSDLPSSGMSLGPESGGWGMGTFIFHNYVFG